MQPLFCGLVTKPPDYYVCLLTYNMKVLARENTPYDLIFGLFGFFFK